MNSVAINNRLIVDDKGVLASYPLGSIYINAKGGISPAEKFGGVWKRFAEGRVLIGAGEIEPNGAKPASNSSTKIIYTSNSEINAGLPNITGEINKIDGYNFLLNAQINEIEQLGALEVSKADYQNWGATGSGAGSVVRGIGFNASKSNNIFGKSPTVQPNALVVNFWQRIDESEVDNNE